MSYARPEQWNTPSPLPEHTLCTANVFDILENLTLEREPWVSAKFIVFMAEITTLEIQPIVVDALSRLSEQERSFS